MLITKSVSVKINNINIKHYIKFVDKYGTLKHNDIINIDVCDLSKWCTYPVEIICDICGEKIIRKYLSYLASHTYNMDCCKKCSTIKQKMTNQINFGCDFPMQNEKIMKKSTNTLKAKYNVENISQREDIRKKRSDRLKDVEYQKKLLSGVRNKYNVDNASSLDFVKQKRRDTTLKNHGVENPTQNYDIFIKSQKSGKKINMHSCGLQYRGTYECNFLDVCQNMDIKLEKGITIEFLFKNKKKYYHSDYYYQPLNLIIEIKSSYYYNLYKELNDCKRLATLEQGYKYIMIIDKNYIDFLNIIKN